MLVILKLRVFARWALQEGVTDAALCRAVTEIESGLVDARLGGFLLKQRVARRGEGKSGGFRTILAHRQGERVVFLYGFAKGERANIDDRERRVLLTLGGQYMDYDAALLDDLVARHVVLRVVCDGQG